MSNSDSEVRSSELFNFPMESLFDGTDCSTSESGLSNSFLDEVFTGSYRNWNCFLPGLFLGRYSDVATLREFIFKLQTSTLWPTNGKHCLDQLLLKAEMDIVQRDKRFPQGSYVFLDDDKWTKIICDLYAVFHAAQQAEVNVEDILDRWTVAINEAILGLQYSINRIKFEHNNKLTWWDPKLDVGTESGSDSDIETFY